jgi:hypothetical protein
MLKKRTQPCKELCELSGTVNSMSEEAKTKGL